MRLIEQTVLVFTAGRTEKVYEIDLCEVGAGQYVVNFRYGRRGKSLKDGSKTVLPVSREEAGRIYAKLRDDKIKAGYIEGGAPTPTSSPTPSRPTPTPSTTPRATSAPPSSPPGPVSSPPPPRAASRGPVRVAGMGARERAVVDRLALGETDYDRRGNRDSGGGVGRRVRGRARRVLRTVTGVRSPETRWKLNRAIWRAGELKIAAAEDLLIGLLHSGRPMRDYCIAWALGFCGSEASIPHLNHMFSDRARPDVERRIAAEALLKVYDDQGRESFRESLVGTLPARFRTLVRGGDAKALSDEVWSFLHRQTNQPEVFEYLHTLYLIDGPVVRPALLRVLVQAPLVPPWFRSFRHLFKAAEYRRDGEVFGLLAYRFEKSRAMFRRGGWGAYVSDGTGRSQWYNRDSIARELSSNKAKIAYSDKTRWYFRRRVWWTLKRLADIGDPDFVKMAVGVLLPFTDSDAQVPKTTYSYSWSRGSRTIHWDRYASYWAFNHILHGNSPRYEVKRGDKTWRCKGSYQPSNGRVPSVREESYPEMWDSTPAGLFHLLDESRCEVVHNFAVKALRSNMVMLGRLDAPLVAMMLGAPYEVTARLGLDLGQRRFNAASPDRMLIIAAATSVLSEARTKGCEWLQSSLGRFGEDGALFGVLLTCAHEDTRWYVRELLETFNLSDQAARALIGRLVSQIMSLGGSEGDAQVAREVAELLASRFGSMMGGLSLEVIQDLLNHEMAEVQAVGAEALLARPDPASTVPSDLVQRLLESKHGAVRVRGVRLLGRFPDMVLLGRQELLMTLMLGTHADAREAARPIVSRLASAHPVFAAEVVRTLVDVLLVGRVSKEVAAHAVLVLREDLSDRLSVVPKDTVWRLLQSEGASAKELGGHLLLTHVDPSELTLEQMVELASHEILSVRQASWRMLEGSVERVRGDLGTVLGVLDVNWADTRSFAFAYFRDSFEQDDWAPGLMISICDSVREDVQRFGRDMISRFFRDEDGQEYLLKLSEHPSTDLQLFVTNYLERYASDSPERIEELSPYFRRVLCGINRGRTTKRRLFSFLSSQATTSEASAKVVAALMTDISASISIESRASALELLVQIHRAHPSVEVPIRVRPRVRSRRCVMVEFNYTYRGSSTVTNRGGETGMSFSPDTTREPTFFSGNLRKNISFREAIGSLHDVVISDLRYKPKDRSQYMEWLARQELIDWQTVSDQRNEVQSQVGPLMDELRVLDGQYNNAMRRYWNAQAEYFNYLYDRDYAAWIVLDPVITVHPDEVFFECFSQDESTYGRLSVGYEVFKDVGDFACGTTNVDYSDALYNEFQKIRSYKNTRFEVDPSGFGVSTEGEADHKEVKIDLPDSWVRGFLQVNSAMALPAVRFDLHPMDVHNFCFVLKRKKEKKGPRAMRYILRPGEPIRVVFEPWEQEVVCSRSIYTGHEAQEIRVWGRRRINILERLVPVTKRFTVHLLGKGMPSFYVADLGDMSFTLGLSGWTKNDWSKSGNFDLMAPRASVDNMTKRRVFHGLKETWFETPDKLAERLGLDRASVLGALGAYTQAGRAIFDLNKGVYRVRELSRDPLPMDKLRFSNPREESATRFVDQNKVTLRQAQHTPEGGVRLSGQVRDGSTNVNPSLVIDADERLIEAQCTCYWYRQNKLFKGPCEHMLALRMKHGQSRRSGRR